MLLNTLLLERAKKKQTNETTRLKNLRKTGGIRSRRRKRRSSERARLLPVQEHVVGRREVDVPTADGHHLEGRAGRQVEHQVGHGLQEPVEHPRQRVDGLAGHVQVAQRVPTPGLGGVAGAVSRADLGRQGDHEPPQQVVQTRGTRHFVQQPVQRLRTVNDNLHVGSGIVAATGRERNIAHDC